jgi:hypothetical protein
MKFIITIVGLLLSAESVRAETSFLEFLHENQHKLVTFKVLDKNLEIEREEKNSFLASFSSDMSLSLGKGQTRPLPSATNFESEKNTQFTSLNFEKKIMNTGTSFHIYSKFNRNQIIGKNPVFSQIPNEYSTRHGLVIEQNVGKNNFGATSRAQLKALEYNEGREKLKLEYSKLELIQSIANEYADLVHLDQLKLIFSEKCSKSKKSLNIAKRKRKRSLITSIELGLIRYHHSNCRNSLGAIDLHLTQSRNTIQNHFLSPVDLSKINGFMIQRSESFLNLEHKLKRIRELEYNFNKFNLRQAKADLLPDMNLNLEYHHYGEGSSESLKYKDQSSEINFKITYKISFGDTNQKQQLRTARIQKLRSEYEGIHREKSTRAKFNELNKTRKNIAMRVAKDISRLAVLKKLRIEAHTKFTTGQINYHQLNDISDAYYETKIKIHEENKSLFINKIDRLLISKGLVGVLQ